MQTLRNKLHKHKTTRRLLSKPLDEADDEIGSDLREGLAWQQRLVDSLLTYSASVTTAIAALTVAHEALCEGGMDEAQCSATPVVQVLLANLQNAACITGEAATATHGLRALSTTLAGYAADLKKADLAAAEKKRYDDKVSNLTEVVAGVPKVNAKIERNRAKLDAATTGTNDAHERAKQSMETCAARRDFVIELADSVVKAAAEGLGSIGKCSAGRWERLSGSCTEGALNAANDFQTAASQSMQAASGFGNAASQSMQAAGEQHGFSFQAPTKPKSGKNTQAQFAKSPWTDLSCTTAGTTSPAPWFNSCCSVQSTKSNPTNANSDKFIRAGSHAKVEA